MKKILVLLMIIFTPLLQSSSGFTSIFEMDKRKSSSPYGVLTFISWSHGWNNNHYSLKELEVAVRLMKEAGVGIVRMDFLWDDVEMVPGKFEFKKYDQIIGLLTRYDIKVLGLLSYNAAWAAEYWNSEPDIILFRRYAREVVRHFKDRVLYWEIWNEPDDPQYWKNQDNMVTYTKLLEAVYPALKEEDPTCQVVLGGLSKSISFSLRAVYQNKGKDFFDIVNMHPFADPTDPDALEGIRTIYQAVKTVMRDFEDASKPIWVTEIGCPGKTHVESDSGWWLGRIPNESVQAAWVQEIYNEMLKWPGVEKVFWAFFRDTSNYFKSGVDYFGLLRNDFSKKPAFEAYQKATLQFRSR